MNFSKRSGGRDIKDLVYSHRCHCAYKRGLALLRLSSARSFSLCFPPPFYSPPQTFSLFLPRIHIYPTEKMLQVVHVAMLLALLSMAPSGTAATDSGCAYADRLEENDLDGCCSASHQCFHDEGVCDADDGCKGSGTCGTDNCPWGENDDCCIAALQTYCESHYAEEVCDDDDGDCVNECKALDDHPGIDITQDSTSNNKPLTAARNSYVLVCITHCVSFLPPPRPSIPF